MEYEDVADAVKQFYYLFECRGGKFMKHMLKSCHAYFEGYEQLSALSDEQKEKLDRISPSTIDRQLNDERKKQKIKGNSYTKKSGLLNDLIPIKTSRYGRT